MLHLSRRIVAVHGIRNKAQQIPARGAGLAPWLRIDGCVLDRWRSDRHGRGWNWNGFHGAARAHVVDQTVAVRVAAGLQHALTLGTVRVESRRSNALDQVPGQRSGGA